MSKNTGGPAFIRWLLKFFDAPAGSVPKPVNRKDARTRKSIARQTSKHRTMIAARESE